MDGWLAAGDDDAGGWPPLQAPSRRLTALKDAGYDVETLSTKHDRDGVALLLPSR